jgi:hypothetical protein
MTDNNTLPVPVPGFDEAGRNALARQVTSPSSLFENIFADAEQTSNLFNGARAAFKALAETLAVIVGPAEHYQFFIKEVPSFLGMPAMALAVGPSPDKPLIDAMVTSKGIQGTEGLVMGKYWHHWAGTMEKPYGYEKGDFNYHSLLTTTVEVSSRRAKKSDKGIFIFEVDRSLDAWRSKYCSDKEEGYAANVWPVNALANRVEGCVNLGWLDFNKATFDFEKFIADLYVRQITPLVIGSRRAEFAEVFRERAIAASRPVGGHVTSPASPTIGKLDS